MEHVTIILFLSGWSKFPQTKHPTFLIAKPSDRARCIATLWFPQIPVSRSPNFHLRGSLFISNQSFNLKLKYPQYSMSGHSMGGMLAVSLVIRNPAFFKGMVLEVNRCWLWWWILSSREWCWRWSEPPLLWNKTHLPSPYNPNQGPLILPDPAQVTPVRLLLGKVACR